MLKDLTVERFVREVASNSPAPGGGSVAAQSGAQAAGLLSMYCNLSQNRKKLGDAVEILQEIGEEARFLMSKMLEAIDEDTVAFNQVMEAYRMPKESDHEKAKRKEAISEAGKYAADVPMHTARGSLRVLSLVNEVAGKGNPSAVTDLGVANLQALAALVGACYNIKINLDMISDREVAKNMESEVTDLLRQGEELYESNRNALEKEII